MLPIDHLPAKIVFIFSLLSPRSGPQKSHHRFLYLYAHGRPRGISDGKVKKNPERNGKFSWISKYFVNWSAPACHRHIVIGISCVVSRDICPCKHLLFKLLDPHGERERKRAQNIDKYSKWGEIFVKSTKHQKWNIFAFVIHLLGRALRANKSESRHNIFFCYSPVIFFCAHTILAT